MRRSDREIKDVDRILNIVDKCKVARLGIVDGGRPYVVALNFGYRRIDNDITLYFHSACEGRKIQVMRENPYVCFEMDCAHGLIEGKKPCAFSFAYESVVGSGKIEFIENREEKNEALNLITSHITGADKSYTFPSQALDNTCVYRLVVQEYTAKINE